MMASWYFACSKYALPLSRYFFFLTSGLREQPAKAAINRIQSEHLPIKVSDRLPTGIIETAAEIIDRSFCRNAIAAQPQPILCNPAALSIGVLQGRISL